MKSARQVLDSQLTERAFQARIITTAQLYGWIVYHVPDSRLVTARGYFDLTIIHPVKHKFLLREIKTTKGRLRPEQVIWLESAKACGLDADVWRPSQWESEIVPTLRG